MALHILNITSLTLLELCALPRKRDRLVFVALLQHRNFRTKENWTYYKSFAEIAEILTYKETSVRNAVTYLQSIGWLSKPQVKVINNPDLIGKKIRVYRWTFPKHEQEFKQAKALIKEREHQNEEKRREAREAREKRNYNGNGKADKDTPQSEIVEGAWEAVGKAIVNGKSPSSEDVN